MSGESEFDTGEINIRGQERVLVIKELQSRLAQEFQLTALRMRILLDL